MICSLVRLVPTAHISRPLFHLSLGTIAPVLPTEPGLLPSSSILLIPNVSLSNIGLEPNEEDGSGWELCIEMDSEREVWFLSQSFDGGTSTSLVGEDAGFEADWQAWTG
jgi:hypothetical protein